MKYHNIVSNKADTTINGIQSWLLAAITLVSLLCFFCFLDFPSLPFAMKCKENNQMRPHVSLIENASDTLEHDWHIPRNMKDKLASCWSVYWKISVKCTNLIINDSYIKINFLCIFIKVTLFWRQDDLVL